MIPLVNLKRQYAGLKSEIDAAVADVMARQDFIAGIKVKTFSEAWLKAIGAADGTACANGTAALSVALRCLGVGPGDEVITTAHTFFATVEAIFAVGASPVFADIDPKTYGIDMATARASARTKAVIPVHLYGNAADMDAVMAFAAAHRLKVVEDVAQAHLGVYGGATLGTIGDAGTFSFYPGKNLGAYGDAGFVVARERAIGRAMAKYVNHGRDTKYTHDAIGENVRMDEIQAAVLSVKLPRLAAWTARRRGVAAYYDSRLLPAGFKTIVPHAKGSCVYHLYVTQVSNRDAVRDAMTAAGVDTGVHYPVPLHRQPALVGLACARAALPHTERAAERVMSLPICADITDDEAALVCDTFLRVAKP